MSALSLSGFHHQEEVNHVSFQGSSQEGEEEKEERKANTQKGRMIRYSSQFTLRKEGKMERGRKKNRQMTGSDHSLALTPILCPHPTIGKRVTLALLEMSLIASVHDPDCKACQRCPSVRMVLERIERIKGQYVRPSISMIN